MTATVIDPKLFTEFERDPDATVGVMWDDFVTAVAMYQATNGGIYAVSVADVAETFNTTVELVREAVDEHPWLYRTEDSDPQKDFIESEGSDD